MQRGARSFVTDTAMRSLYRSVVYTPGSNVRAMRKIKEAPSLDGVILDLEDAVAPDSKAQVYGRPPGHPCGGLRH
jgi:hypothetical protein